MIRIFTAGGVIYCPSCLSQGRSSSRRSFITTQLKPKDERPYAKPMVQKLPVVKVWRDITPEELGRIISRDGDEVWEAMVTCGVDDLHEIKSISKILAYFKYRCDIIPKPEEDSGESKDESELKPKSGKMLIPRPPVVTIMGHVDHGKTTLLDSLRKSEIVKQESGGITQHIGAFVVSLSEPGVKVKVEQRKMKTEGIKSLVTFLDTPGHAAFHAMRQRGASVTDIVVLVVAADDGVMDQTVESINFAKNSKVPIVVAINKMDKVASSDMSKSIESLKRGLMAQGILLEEDGGDTQSVRISALNGSGLEELKEAILALAETLDLRSYGDGDSQGSVIESCLHPHRGRLATLLMRTGTLRRGDIIVAGTESWAKIRSMFDEWGNILSSVGPAIPVQIIGWKDESIPHAGDHVVQVSSEKRAKAYVEANIKKRQEQKFLDDMREAEKKGQQHLEKYKKHLEDKRSSDKKFAKFYRLGAKEAKEKMIQDDPDADKKINMIIKADVAGSLEVLLDVFGSYPNEKEVVKLDIIHYGLGPVTESDLDLASCFSNTFIYGFNIKNDPKIKMMAKKSGIPLKGFNVIYHMVDDVKSEISSRIPEVTRESVLGEAIVLQEFLLNEKNKKIPVAGCRCIRGCLKKASCFYRVIRSDYQQQQELILAENLVIKSMRHIKDEVDTINKDFECGLRFDSIQDSLPDLRFQTNDRIICYQIQNVKAKTKWTPQGF